MFAFTLKPEVTNYTVFDVSDRLRERGWLVPAYTFPANREDLSVLRIVVRAGMSHEMGDLLLRDLRARTAALEALDGPLPHGDRRSRRSRTERPALAGAQATARAEDARRPREHQRAERHEHRERLPDARRRRSSRPRARARPRRGSRAG